MLPTLLVRLPDRDGVEFCIITTIWQGSASTRRLQRALSRIRASRSLRSFMSRTKPASQQVMKAETIALYQNIRIFAETRFCFSPGVSAVDCVCHRNSFTRTNSDWYPELEQKHPDWCWLREYLRLSARNMVSKWMGTPFIITQSNKKYIPKYGLGFRRLRNPYELNTRI